MKLKVHLELIGKLLRLIYEHKKLTDKTLIAKANKFKKIKREKPTLVVFQKIHSQTYLQSPKSMKSSSVRNQSNHLSIRINLTICFQCFLSAIKTALLLRLGENTEKEQLLLARLRNSRRTVFVDSSHKS